MDEINELIDFISTCDIHDLKMNHLKSNENKRRKKTDECYGCIYGPHEKQSEKQKIKSKTWIDQNEIFIKANRMDDFKNIINTYNEKNIQLNIVLSCEYYYSEYHKIPSYGNEFNIVDKEKGSLVINLPEVEYQRLIPLNIQDGHENYIVTKYNIDEINEICKKEYKCDLQKSDSKSPKNKVTTIGNICQSSWMPWLERDKLEHLKYPGVYLIGKYNKNSVNEDTFDILYIGETKRTLKTRLNEFHKSAFINKARHSGGNIFKFRFLPESVWNFFCEYPVPEWLFCKVISFKNIENERILIPSFESLLIDNYIKHHKKIPPCNTK